MALSPTRGWGGFAWAVAGGPTPKWGSGGMAGGTSAAGMRLPLAPRVTGNVPRGSPPSVHRSGRQRVPPNRGATGVGCAAYGGDSKPTAADANAHGRGSKGADAPRRPLGTLPAAPRVGYCGGGSGPSTVGLPPAMGAGTGPSVLQEVVYTPTAHEGTPR